LLLYRKTVRNAMNRDRIDECKREIDRLKSEMLRSALIPICSEIKKVVSMPRNKMASEENRRIASRVIQLNLEAHRRAEKSHEFALEMVQLVKETPNDPKSSLILKIADVMIKICEVTKESIKVASYKKAMKSPKHIGFLTRSCEVIGLLFMKYEKIVEEYDRIASTAATNATNGDKIEGWKRNIDRLTLEAIPLCWEVTQTVQTERFTSDEAANKRLAMKIVDLNKEIHQRAKESYRSALEMLQQVKKSPDDPRTSVISEIVDVMRVSLKVATEALQMEEHLYNLTVLDLKKIKKRSGE
ncbi:hypothetical protein PENTCL1PPCAC_3972, partial [Pristionchus entomophagus]